MLVTGMVANNVRCTERSKMYLMKRLTTAKKLSKKLLALVLALCLMGSLITVIKPASAAPIAYTLASGIKAEMDDSEEWLSGSSTGVIDIDSSDLELGYEKPTEANPLPQIVALRFAELAIPQGAVITNAYIQFTADSDQDANGATTKSTDSFSFNICAEAADNSAAIVNAPYNISSRARTATSVAWAGSDGTTKWVIPLESGVNQQTPDLTALVQEIVNRPAWVSGNAMSFMVTGSGNRTAVSSKGNLSVGPVLHLTYTVEQNGEQSAPAGLLGIAPTSAANNDGQIAGTTADMEFKPSASPESAYTACSDLATFGLASGSYDVRYAAKAGFNASPVTPVSVPAFLQELPATLTLLDKNSFWKYDDSNTDMGTAWRTAGYNDSAWKTGKGPLGYPAADSNPTFGVLSSGTLVANAAKPNAYITYYFRDTFEVTAEALAKINQLNLTVGIDDGYVLYINGTEVRRDYMPAGDITWQTWATLVNEPSSAEGTITADITAAALPLLTAGTNTIAVEVHNRDNTSSDIYFDMLLNAMTGQPNQEQGAPTGLAGVAPTSSVNNDGQITGTSNLMEYKLSSGAMWTACVGASVTGLSAGSYDVRYAARTGFNASPSVSVAVPAFGGSSYDVKDLTLQPGSNETQMNFCWYSAAASAGSSVRIAKVSELVGGALPVTAVVFSGTCRLSASGGYNSNEGRRDRPGAAHPVRLSDRRRDKLRSRSNL